MNIFWCWVDISIYLVYTWYILSIYECLSIHVVHNSMFWCRFSRCPRDLLDSTKDTFPFRDTVEVCSELQAERERQLDPDGTPRDGCKEKVYIKYILTLFLSYDDFIPSIYRVILPTLFLSYDDFIPSIYRLYSCHMTTSFHLYTDYIFWAGEGGGARLAA